MDSRDGEVTADQDFVEELEQFGFCPLHGWSMRIKLSCKDFSRDADFHWVGRSAREDDR